MPARLSARVRVIAALVVAFAALAGMILLVTRIRSDENGVGELRFASSTPAAAPFASFRESRVAVGSRCLRVLVASTESQRVQGLREARSLAPYDGMLFVFAGDTNARFTMADTPMPLDMTFFSHDGAPVDHAQMAPCPHGSDTTCPEYAAERRYRYALEQPAGSSAQASGTLGPCAA